jgi:hypothetical protein
MEYLLRASNSLPADESHDIYIYRFVGSPGIQTRYKQSKKIAPLSTSENFVIKRLPIAVYFASVD